MSRLREGFKRIMNIPDEIIAKTKSKLEEKKQVLSLEELSSKICLLYTSPSPRDRLLSRMPSSA